MAPITTNHDGTNSLTQSYSFLKYFYYFTIGLGRPFLKSYSNREVLLPWYQNFWISTHRYPANMAVNTKKLTNVVSN